MKKQIILVLDNIRSLYNVGSIFRIADAAGVTAVFLCGITGFPGKKFRREVDGIDPDNPPQNYIPSKKCFESFLGHGIKKTALESFGRVNWQYFPETKSAIKHLKDAGFNILALEQHEHSQSYDKHSFQFPCAIVLGTEVTGIEPEIFNLCQGSIEIPMRGAGKSLNVAVAASIVLYKATEEKK